MTKIIHVMRDESLGGTLREYREVKRKARVGELVKATGDCGEFYSDGDIGIVVKLDGDGDAWANFDSTGRRACAGNHVRGEYVVLEPTDILVIDTPDGGGKAARYRLVDRKAAVGERVIVVSDHMCHDIPPGEVGRIEHGDTFDYENTTYYVGNDKEPDTERDYRVLDPLPSADSTLLSDKPAEDQAAANIVALTLKVTELESRLNAIYEWHKRAAVDLRAAREDIVLIEEGVSDDIKALEKRILALETGSAPSVVEIGVTKSAAVKEAVPSPQQIRDEVVERAKADVSDLRKFAGIKIPNDRVHFWPKTELPHDYNAMHTVDFVVNSAKRTVVAIIRCTVDGLTTRGFAKCAPGEVFNAHIGRAIALRRALGLEVPAEYLSVTQPEEVRVGDIVRGNSTGKLAEVTTVDGRYLSGRYNDGNHMCGPDDHYTLVDDSGVTAASTPSSRRREVA